ncbi:FCD domain-containing protein [Curtobacterium sp. Curtsp57]|uniref:FCD domain-containing protein n=1 Tax=Curtobacterium sp. Curtsp57 TaxID=3243047 RepID=UPI0039B3847B
MIFDRVLDELGSAIVRGDLPVGHGDSVEGFVARTGASRSIVREATRVLVSLGMLSAGRRVGLRVLPAEQWDVIDPHVVRWRLDGPDRAVALAELRALRRAVEPAAAAAAARAVASGTHDRSDLEALLASAERLASAAGAADPAPILPADRAFHGRLLALSGNAMFARLQRVVERALEERADVEPDAHDVALHRTLADAVAAGDADRAAAAMREIVDRT